MVSITGTHAGIANALQKGSEKIKLFLGANTGALLLLSTFVAEPTAIFEVKIILTLAMMCFVSSLTIAFFGFEDFATSQIMLGIFKPEAYEAFDIATRQVLAQHAANFGTKLAPWMEMLFALGIGLTVLLGIIKIWFTP